MENPVATSKVGALVRANLQQVFEHCETDPQFFADLLDRVKTKATFKMSSYSFLAPVDSAVKGRYWTDVFVVRGQRLRVVSQWNESHRPFFLAFLQGNGMAPIEVGTYKETARPPTKKLKHFKAPAQGDIARRVSTITSEFTRAIIPVKLPTQGEIDAVLGLLGMHDAPCCAYCGGKKDTWDHFRAVVKDNKPTGYITEIQNLVPCCSTCNSKKRNKDWREWMLAEEAGSPASRKVPDLAERLERLEKFEKWREPTLLTDVPGIVGAELWQKYWDSLEEIKNLLKAAQNLAKPLRDVLAQCKQ